MRDRDLVRIRRMSQATTSRLYCLLWGLVALVAAGWIYFSATVPA